MKSALHAHLLLFALSLTLAGLVWYDGQRVDETQRYRLLRLSADEIQSIRHLWPGGATRVDLTGACPDQDYLLMLQQNKIDDANDKREVPAHPVPPSDVVHRGIGLLTPLDASRRLPRPDAQTLAELGLTEPERRMILLTDQGRIELLFGQETYGGEGRYLQIVGEPDVYLVSGAVPRSFEGPPNRLIASQRLRIDATAISEISIGLDQPPRRFVHRHPEQASLRRFEAEDQPGVAQPGINRIITLLQALHSRRYQPAQAIAAPLLSIYIERPHCPTVPLRLAADASGQGYWLQVGRWRAPMNEVAGKKLLEDVRAALPL